ncbi:MAG: toll/interleukin-1 receptor domain-containing protein [Anaerolineales bacterium]
MSSSQPLKIFLCHSSGDKPQVEKLYDFFSKQGADPWLDSEKLLPGQDWNYEINKALDDSDVILLCLSKKSVDKEGYVQREVRIALDRALEMPEGRIFLIPGKLEECDLPRRLQSYQWVDLFTEKGMAKLVKSLNLRAQQVGAKLLSTE